MKLDVGSTLRCARWGVRRTVTVATSVYTAPKQRVLLEGVWALMSSLKRRYGCTERAKLKLAGDHKVWLHIVRSHEDFPSGTVS